ncbi:hypothetical protein BH09PAT2_BH09PAT2_08960 [soil metagenome]
MRRFVLPFTIIACLLIFISAYTFAQADELEDINKKLSDLENSLKSSQSATQTNEQNLANLNAQLNGIKAQVNEIEIDIEKKTKDIDVGENRLLKQKRLLDERIVSFYKNKGKEKDALLHVLVSDNLPQFLQQFTYQQNLLDEDRKVIVRIVMLVKEIEDKKAKLESEQSRLIPIKESIDKQSTFLSGEVVNAKKYQQSLKQEIASLSARQTEIINSRSGGFTVNIGDSEAADDYNASIKGFRESAPGGYFAVFSFGAFTHRKGMSQYGAYGRANQGQDFKRILKEYYGKEPVSKDTGGSIKVAGYGDLDFETTYLYGIAEMPSSWHPEALKAQAVAARSYAYRYKQNGTEICTNEACQAFRKDKSDNPPEAWKKAVDDTKGQVLEDVVTFYASTSGGYLTTKGWDTTDGQGGSNFLEKSYEKIAGSPWVYKAWYTKAYSINSDKCGRSSPWLSPEEMADIVNATLVLQKGSGSEVERITPVTTQCWSGNPYSMSELRDIAKKYGGIEQATSVNVSLGDGVTNSVTINGVSMNGADFKKAFSLRAPGYLAIPQSGFSFFNVERK